MRDEPLAWNSHTQALTPSAEPTSTLLRHHQVGALRAAESAISDGRHEFVVEMAVGSGKTLTAASLAYQLIGMGVANKVLYLVNRANLEGQAVHTLLSLPGAATAPVVKNSADSPGGHLSKHSGMVGPYVVVSTIQSLLRYLGTASLRENESGDLGALSAAESAIESFDFIIADGVDASLDSNSASRRAVESLNAPIAHFTANIKRAHGSGIPTVYSYTTEQALNDGILVDYSPVPVSASDWRNAYHPRAGTEPKGWRVVLAYIGEDSRIAGEIESLLENNGIEAVSASADMGDSKGSRGKSFLTELGSEDIFVPLVSSASLDSFWVSESLWGDLDRRGIGIVPAIVKTGPIPQFLADRAPVDIADDTYKIVEFVNIARHVRLDSLEPSQFESLACELLRRLNFDIERSVGSDANYDFLAEYRDRLGFADPVQYIVEVKFGSPLVRTIRQLASVVAADRYATRGLLITSNQLTSTAQAALASTNAEGPLLHVLDGLRIKSHLLAHQSLVYDYFADRLGRR